MANSRNDGPPNVNWSVYSCSQNLPAILNDPTRGKQKDFFTKIWGESFTETATVPPCSSIEEVPNSFFLPYLRKLMKRYKKLQERKSSLSVAHESIFPQLGSKEASYLFRSESSPIPKIFFSQNFTLTNAETFREVFTIEGTALPPKSLQDKLSHHLDLVEVGLAQQISKKSSAFFSAVSTQDKVAEKVSSAILDVNEIRKDLQGVKKQHVVDPLAIVKNVKKKSRAVLLLQKLQLMSTVHQAQRAIQSLLGNSDYVGALDLISTTQEVLRQELQGLVSFRHLDSQLVEIRNAIEKMLRAELERNLSADLNRPIEQMDDFNDKDRLISIVLGHLRLGKIAPIISVVSKEVSTAMTATCKQTLIEAVSELDSKSDSMMGSNAIHLNIPLLPSELWLRMIESLGERLIRLLIHIKDIILLFKSCADSALYRSCDTNPSIVGEVEEPLISADVFSKFESELSSQLDKTTEAADEKFTSVLRNRRTWMNRKEVLTTLKVVNQFVEQLEMFVNSLKETGTPPKSRRYGSFSEMKTQTAEFYREFHSQQTTKINSSLDTEKWKIAKEGNHKSREKLDIRQLMSANDFEDNNDMCNNSICEEKDTNESKDKPPSNMANGKKESLDSEAYKGAQTAESFFLLMDLMVEYCKLSILPNNAEVMLGLVDLLRAANSRIAHLVLGAGAVELKICKSITVSNLVIVARGLCLVIELFPQVKDIFRESVASKNHHMLKHLDAVQSEIATHSEDIETKMLSILGEIMDSELKNWEARPPVPSTPITNISRGIARFKEAIGSVLSQRQLSNIFFRVDKTFRAKLRDRIEKLGIKKDGGPRHGVVTSEMMHYAESLRKLNVLPANVISNSSLTNDLWS